jgi:hypothetical protein
MASRTRASSVPAFFVGWRLPAALLLLGAIPLVAGVARLVGLAAGRAITPENARFFASPLPVVLHLAGAVALAVLGAFQVAPELRRRHPRWHRAAGRAALVGGVVAGLSGLWMSLRYPAQPQDGTVLLALRLFFGVAMVLCLTIGFVQARRRRYAQHGAWMVRTYAIGLGAGTQALLHLPWVFLAGTPGRAGRAFLMGAGWVLNLLVAQWLLTRRRGSSRTGGGTRPRTYSDSRTRPAAQSP